MIANEFSYALLAAAVKAAGGTVTVSHREFLQLQAESQLDIRNEPVGGYTLTLQQRPGVTCLDEILLRAHQDEAR
jgi:hypothetical protein